MRWVPDRTGRFRWRPWYSKDDIDQVCENRMGGFLRERHGLVAYPVSTDDLTRFIERETDDLDLYADLTGLGQAGVEVEGVTTFVRGHRPRVQIARSLSLTPGREPRLRTTLAHELGHVLLHNFVAMREDELLPDGVDDGPPACVDPGPPARPGVDWMEWQAGYACGALLMPTTELHAVVQPVLERYGTGLPVGRSAFGPLIDRVQGHFLVSAAAAHMRLRRLGYVASFLL